MPQSLRQRRLWDSNPGLRVLAEVLCSWPFLPSRSLAAAPSLVRSVPLGLAIGHPEAPARGSQGSPAMQSPQGTRRVHHWWPRDPGPGWTSRLLHGLTEGGSASWSWPPGCSYAPGPGSPDQVCNQTLGEEATGDPETWGRVLRGLGLAEASVYRGFSGTRDRHLPRAT